MHERLEELFRWDGAANRAWTVRIDYEGEKRMMEKAMALGVEQYLKIRTTCATIFAPVN